MVARMAEGVGGGLAMVGFKVKLALVTSISHRYAMSLMPPLVAAARSKV
jgi:hypothetical protein